MKFILFYNLIKCLLKYPNQDDICLQNGNNKNPCQGLDICPPCWLLNTTGTWFCYDYKDGQCPILKSIIDLNIQCNEKDLIKPRTFIPNLNNCPNPIFQSCFPGGIETEKLCTGNQCPPCWIKKNKNTWACYNKLEDQKCPFPTISHDITKPSFQCKVSKIN